MGKKYGSKGYPQRNAVHMGIIFLEGTVTSAAHL
jgi:hypothetical protein